MDTPYTLTISTGGLAVWYIEANQEQREILENGNQCGGYAITRDSVWRPTLIDQVDLGVSLMAVCVSMVSTHRFRDWCEKYHVVFKKSDRTFYIDFTHKKDGITIVRVPIESVKIDVSSVR